MTLGLSLSQLSAPYLNPGPSSNNNNTRGSPSERGALLPHSPITTLHPNASHLDLLTELLEEQD